MFWRRRVLLPVIELVPSRFHSHYIVTFGGYWLLEAFATRPSSSITWTITTSKIDCTVNREVFLLFHLKFFLDWEVRLCLLLASLHPLGAHASLVSWVRREDSLRTFLWSLIFQWSVALRHLERCYETKVSRMQGQGSEVRCSRAAAPRPQPPALPLAYWAHSCWKCLVLPVEMPGIRNHLFRPDPPLEISLFGLGFLGSRLLLLVGLGCQLVGSLAYHSSGRVRCTLFHRKLTECLTQSPPITLPY